MNSIKIPRTGEGYFSYERLVALQHLLPWLNSLGTEVSSGGVLDVGCGYGGTVAAVREVYGRIRAIGLDLDPQMVALGRLCLGQEGELRVENFFEFTESEFDLLLMRDVLEHIPEVEKAVTRAFNLLRPEGAAYVSFAPFYSPFGGHQHNAEGFASHLPWLQVLPEKIFRQLLTFNGNWYKTKTDLQKDMDSVLATRLSVKRFLLAADHAGFKILAVKGYLSRPEYAIKLGLPTVALPTWPMVRDLFCTGIEAVLQKPGLRS